MSSLSIDAGKIFHAHPYARVILERLTQAGFETVMIGGIVRDALRGQFEPDYEFVPDEVDIATAARPEEIRALFPETKILELGEAFGVLLLLSPEGNPCEVATFRSESEYDGRWPSRIALVRRLEDDVRRRDLTVNGLAATIDGRVVDLIGGVDDLRSKTIRTIGDPDERLREDFLRILRVVRLACALDGHILPEVSEALRRHREGLRVISAERIRDELMRILQTPRATKGVQLLDEHGILELILPEVAACKGVPQPEKYHPEGDVYTHTLLALACADRIIRDPLVKLAVLLHDIGKPIALQKNNFEHAGAHEMIGEQMAANICRRLRLSVEEIKLIRFLVREHLRIGKFAEMGVGKQVALLRTHEEASISFEHPAQRFPYFTKLLSLMVCDCEASAHRSSGWMPVIRALIPLLHRLQELGQRERARKLLDGHDLIALGLKPGPRVREILEAVYEKIFSGEITTREAALAEARQWVK
jgi:tRNA nucleotidyltransferase/poly(A) polymerase